ncbi:hypothetical protein RFI_38543, partial [Reticulomyxa filosa]
KEKEKEKDEEEEEEEEIEDSDNEFASQPIRPDLLAMAMGQRRVTPHFNFNGQSNADQDAGCQSPKIEIKRGSLATLQLYHRQKLPLTRTAPKKRGSFDDSDIALGAQRHRQARSLRYVMKDRVLNLNNAMSNPKEQRLSQSEISEAKQMETKTKDDSSDVSSDKSENVMSPKEIEEHQLMLQKMSKEIEIKNRTYENQTITDSFVGRDAVTWMQSKSYTQSRSTGLILGRKLQQLGFIQYAGGKNDKTNHSELFEDEIDRFYRLLVQAPVPAQRPSESKGSNVAKAKSLPLLNSEKSKSHTPQPHSQSQYNLVDRRFTLNPLLMELPKLFSDAQMSRHRDTYGMCGLHKGKSLVKEECFVGNDDCGLDSTKQRPWQQQSKAISLASQMFEMGIIKNIKKGAKEFVDSKDEFYQIESKTSDRLLPFNDDYKDMELYSKSASPMFPPMGILRSADTSNQSVDESVGSNGITENTLAPSMSAPVSIIGKYDPSMDRHQKIISPLAHAWGGQFDKSSRKQRSRAIKNLLTHVILIEMHRMHGNNGKFQEETFARLHQSMKNHFMECDKENRGALEKREFAEWLAVCGLHLFPDDVNTIFSMFDIHATGLLDYRDFLQNSVPKFVPGILTPILIDLLKHAITIRFGVW